MSDYESVSLYVSAISAMIALWAVFISRKTADEQKKIAQRTQRLEERNLAATHHGKYSELLFSVQAGISGSRDRLSGAARQALDNMINLFDCFSSSEGVRPTRHIFHEMCESIYEGFAPQLVWQSGLNLSSRFSSMKYLEKDLPSLYERRSEIQKRASREVLDLKEIHKKDPNARMERLVMESARFQLRLLELCDRITMEDRNKLLQAALSPISKFVEVHREERPKLTEALQRLERGLGQNSLEEFQLEESQALHSEYMREMARIEVMELFSLSEAEYLEGVDIGFVFGQLLYFGSLLYTMQMCREWIDQR